MQSLQRGSKRQPHLQRHLQNKSLLFKTIMNLKKVGAAVATWPSEAKPRFNAYRGVLPTDYCTRNLLQGHGFSCKTGWAGDNSEPVF